VNKFEQYDPADQQVSRPKAPWEPPVP